MVFPLRHGSWMLLTMPFTAALQAMALVQGGPLLSSCGTGGAEAQGGVLLHDMLVRFQAQACMLGGLTRPWTSQNNLRKTFGLLAGSIS